MLWKQQVTEDFFVISKGGYVVCALAFNSMWVAFTYLILISQVQRESFYVYCLLLEFNGIPKHEYDWIISIKAKGNVSNFCNCE